MYFLAPHLKFAICCDYVDDGEDDDDNDDGDNDDGDDDDGDDDGV